MLGLGLGAIARARARVEALPRAIATARVLVLEVDTHVEDLYMRLPKSIRTPEGRRYRSIASVIYPGSD